MFSRFKHVVVGSGFCFHFLSLLLFSCSVLFDSFATPWTAAYQAPLFTGFPGQEYGTGLPFPPAGHLPNPGIDHMSPALADGSLFHWTTNFLWGLNFPSYFGFLTSLHAIKYIYIYNYSIFIIDQPFYHYKMFLFISSNIFCFKVCFVY